jgi:hypothetical protein
MTMKRMSAVEMNLEDIIAAINESFGDELTSDEFRDIEPEPLHASFREMLSQQQQTALRRFRNNLPKGREA